MKSRSLLPLLLCVVLVACGKEAKEDKEAWLGESTPHPSTAETAGTTEDPTHPASPGGKAVVPDTSAGTTVVVMLEDGRIAVPPDPVPPGPAVITVTNGGKEMHNLFLEGQGVSVVPPGIR